jgi:hypothetical protein
MTRLRARAEHDLGHTLEAEFSIPVSLIAPDGQLYATDAMGKELVGRVVWSQPRTNLDTGDVAILHDPMVTLRRSSLSRVPLTGEHWLVLLPDGPAATSPTVKWLLDASRAVEGNESLGTVRLSLTQVAQA